MNRSRTASRPPIGCAQLPAARAALLLGTAEARAGTRYTLERGSARAARRAPRKDEARSRSAQPEVQLCSSQRPELHARFARQGTP